MHRAHVDSKNNTAAAACCILIGSPSPVLIASTHGGGQAEWASVAWINSGMVETKTGNERRQLGKRRGRKGGGDETQDESKGQSQPQFENIDAYTRIPDIFTVQL